MAFLRATAILLLASAALVSCGLTVTKQELGEFNAFKTQFGRQYESEATEQIRLQVFTSNLRYIDSFNQNEAAQRGYRLGVNQFADMTNQEFRSQMLGLKMDPRASVNTMMPEGGVRAGVRDLPTSVDWRTKGYVTPVKDQGQCGSCWAFSTTGAIEGLHFNQTGKLISLSEQQLVDCSWLDMGCNGGQPMIAYEYVRMNGGLETEAAYPYKAVGGSCVFNKNSAVATIGGFHHVWFSESSLQTAVATVGPISVAMDASGKDFQLYKDGIYNPSSCSSFMLDHAVLAVGYGVDAAGKDFWLVKNSWNTTWGMQGYFNLARNAGNKCGIATSATYPHA